MKDLYQTLKLTSDASPQEIKRAYRKLALGAHPDRGGNVEVMTLLNEAYETLSDPIKRRDFDERWSAFRESDIEQEGDFAIAGHLATDTPPYSQEFREQYRALVSQYEHTPLIGVAMRDCFKPFTSDIYRFKKQGAASAADDIHDIFAFIRAKSAQHKGSLLSPSRETLDPVMIVGIFRDFLLGNYYGEQLLRLQEYLSSEIARVKSLLVRVAELPLYEGIFEIILMAKESPNNQNNLWLSIKKITDFAKQADEASLLYLIPLFYNKYFRNLFSYALHLYWQSNEDLFDTKNLNLFDGQVEAKELLDVLRDRLSHGAKSEGLGRLVQYVKLLFNFEKDLNKAKTAEQPAAYYREGAFHLLDWIPALCDRTNGQILVNVFLQIGISFQQASRLESQPALKMADEKLALKMYLTAIGIGYHTTPDVELYANIQALKYIATFQYKDSILDEAIPALQKSTLIIADVFPFFSAPQSNITFLRQEDRTIHLMRRLLNMIIEMLEYNKTHSDRVALDHSAVTLLYQAYEACLKNWYQEEYDPATERKFRLDLMEELLFDNSWTFLDVDKNIDTPWIMVARDKEGWMKPTRSLPYTEDPRFVKYRTINGTEINQKTGEITFFMVPWGQDRPIYEKAFTLFDLKEMLEKNLAAAIFSLDPVDPDKPYHPFNAMRFAPSQLYESELLNTMLLTDYTLKFLTTNQEVQGQYPYVQRPVDQMIQHLPEYLRQIICDFHREQRSGALHRFWIEAEGIDVSLSDQASGTNGMVRVGLGCLKMVVKKHRMERDIHGDLKDVGNEDEGWPIYVFTPEQMHELETGRRIISGSAMIFIYAESRVFFWERNKIIYAHAAENYRETLIRLYKQPRDELGKVAISSKNMSLIYRVTKEMARQTGLSHRYSPEFIFAHEFTTHYDEFAQYLPEFGRLKELSRISALIRFLDGIRKANEESLQALIFLLDTPLQRPTPETNAYKGYSQGYQRVCQNITEVFQKWTSELAPSILYVKWQAELKCIREQIGCLTFDSHSEEVNEVCQRLYQQISDDNPGAPSYLIWSQAIDPRRDEIAREISSAKQANCRRQLDKLFSALLTPMLSSYAYQRLIDSFLEWVIDPLAKELANHERLKAQREIIPQFPTSSASDIILALDGRSDAVVRVANEESCRQLREQKTAKERAEAGFVRIGLGKHEEPVDLKGKCLWVPASVRHEVKKDERGLSRYSFFVYGGVSIQPEINVTQGGGPLGGDSVGADSFSQEGAKLYRVYGDEAGPYGHYWSQTDPGAVANFRDYAGLPEQNTGRFVIEGTLISTEGVVHGSAAPVPGRAGGGDEVRVPDPRQQVRVDRVSGVNPEI